MTTIGLNAFGFALLLGWLPFAFVLFLWVRPTHRAVAVSLVVGWLLLPVAGLKLPGVPVWDKTAAVGLGTLLAALLTDAPTLYLFRPTLFDFPMAAWCLAPLASSITNDLGVYDGLSGVMRAAISWGVPYFLGRVYFRDAERLKDLAVTIVVGGLAYAPLALFEVRMSPRLHLLAYGFMQNDFSQQMRLGGFRPMVFLQHGLAVSQWFLVSALIAIWLSACGAVRSFAGIPASLAAAALVVTMVLCKSLNAIVLLPIGLGALAAGPALGTAGLVLVLSVLPLTYSALRATGRIQTTAIVRSLEKVAPDRAQSLEFRFEMEDKLCERAKERPVFGWGGYGRSAELDATSDRLINDDLWIIAYGMNGVFGLVSIFAALAAAPLNLCMRSAARRWAEPDVAPVALAVCVALYAIDSVPNNMFDPPLVAAAGGIVAALWAREFSVDNRLRRA